MSEEHEVGGGKGTIDLPKIGPVKKTPLIVIGGAAAAYIAWRYWQASQAAAAGQEDAPADPGYEDGGTIPAVSGQGPITGYAPADADNSADTYGFHGTTNSQWSQYVTTQLSASDRWSYTDIVAALGQYLANKPLTSGQQQIVQAGIAVAGQPPEGTHVVVPGGDVPITVAPSGLRAWDATTDTQIGLQWNAVAGASHYRLFRSDTGSEPVGDSYDTKAYVRGLTPNKTYSIQVAAVTASGKTGPKSAVYKARTKAVTLAKPSAPRVTMITRTGATVTTGAVKGATGYLWYVNGAQRGHSDRPTHTLSGLSANKAYKVHVRADNTTQAPGPASADTSFRTRK